MRGLPMLALGALVAALAMVPARASASPSCSGGSSGGSSGSSSSGGSGSSSSGSSSSGSSSSSTPACVQTTTTVGRAECRSFGEGWDRSHQPRIRLSMGLTHTSLSLSNFDLEGEATHDDQKHAYHYDPTRTGGPAPQTELLGGAFGIQFLIRDAHIGVEMGVAGGSSDGAEQINAQGLRMRSTTAIQGQAKIVGGYAARLGKWGVLGELHTGVRMTSLNLETRLEDCITESFTTSVHGILEPRIGVQRWLSPWLTTDLSVGSDLLIERDLSVTLNLTAHSRSYDGL